MSDRGAPDRREGVILAELDDGLVIRHARRDDAEAVIALNADVHRNYGMTEPDAFIGAWTRDLFELPHPSFDVTDFMVVEDRATGAIVSSLNLFSQTWTYDGVPFGVGRPELVGTRPEYRRRGLVRRQFDALHRWSAERGELLQGITGIPWYYRQFGYEYALGMPASRDVARANVPRLAEGKAEPFRVRAAVADDAPFVAGLDGQGRARSLVACVRDAAMWRYEIDGRGDLDGAEPYVSAIEDGAGARVGYLLHNGRLRDGTLSVMAYELAVANPATGGSAAGDSATGDSAPGGSAAGASWRAVTPSILRHVARLGEAYERDQKGARFDAIGLRLGDGHPALPWAVGARDALGAGDEYAWYIRVVDLPAFLRRIAPVLERRLADGGAGDLTGEVLLNFYRSGLRLAFQSGRLSAVEPWAPERALADAAFPDPTFLKILFGYRSLAELRQAFPDCHGRDGRSAALLGTLFPKRQSVVWPID